MANFDIKEHEDFYYNEQGYKVFTEKFHLSEDIAAKVVVDTALTDTIKRQTHL